jgi:hypothetical protein
MFFPRRPKSTTLLREIPPVQLDHRATSSSSSATKTNGSGLVKLGGKTPRNGFRQRRVQRTFLAEGSPSNWTGPEPVDVDVDGAPQRACPSQLTIGVQVFQAQAFFVPNFCKENAPSSLILLTQML